MIGRLGVCLALGALLAAIPGTPAQAHALMESSTPERDAVLVTSPGEVVLRFSEPVEVKLGAVRVRDADGKEVQQGAAFHPGGDGSAVGVRLAGGLPDGGYTATYRVISADSHPVAGGFVFAVGKSGVASSAAIRRLLAAERSGPATSVAFGVVRAVQFAAIALGCGALAVLLLVWLPAVAVLALPDTAWQAASEAFAARWRRLLLVAASVGAISALLGLPMEAALADGSTFWAALSTAGDVLGTRFGIVWGLGALAWLLVLGLAVARKARAPAVLPATVGASGVALPRPGPWLLALAVPLLWLSLLPALGGHAGVQQPVVVLLPANVLHVLAASAWIGGIATLLMALPAATRQLDLIDRTVLLTSAIGRFSTLALVSVAALLVGGIVQSLLALTTLGDLVETAYGRAILIKSVLVAMLLCAGALNRQRTLPALGRRLSAGASPGRPGVALAYAMRCELALGGAALAVTGALAGYVPPDNADAGPFSTSATLGPARAELTVQPSRAGPNDVQLLLFDRARGAPWDKAEELRVRGSLPARDIAPIELEARKAGPGHYVVRAARLAPAGEWTLSVVARVSEFDEYRTNFEVAVR